MKTKRIQQLVPGALLCLAGITMWVVHAQTPPQPCDNKAPSTLLEDRCVICTKDGPVAANNGRSCSYYTADKQVFCDCAPGINCAALGPVPAQITFYTGGTCWNMVCTGAVVNAK